MIALLSFLFPDIDNLDRVMAQAETVLAVWIAALAILLAFVVIGDCIQRFKKRSPVEKLLRRRFG